MLTELDLALTEGAPEALKRLPSPRSVMSIGKISVVIKSSKFNWAPYAQLYTAYEIPHPPAFCLFLSYLSLIYEGFIGQPKETTSRCDPPVMRNKNLPLGGSSLNVE